LLLTVLDMVAAGGAYGYAVAGDTGRASRAVGVLFAFLASLYVSIAAGCGLRYADTTGAVFISIAGCIIIAVAFLIPFPLIVAAIGLFRSLGDLSWLNASAGTADLASIAVIRVGVAMVALLRGFHLAIATLRLDGHAFAYAAGVAGRTNLELDIASIAILIGQ